MKLKGITNYGFRYPSVPLTHTHTHTHTLRTFPCSHLLPLSFLSFKPMTSGYINDYCLALNHTYKNDTISHTQTHKPKSTHTPRTHHGVHTHNTHTRTHTNTHSSSYTRTAAENKASFLYLGMHVTGMANFSFLCY